LRHGDSMICQIYLTFYIKLQARPACLFALNTTCRQESSDCKPCACPIVSMYDDSRI
jgi:hypothetical protein